MKKLAIIMILVVGILTVSICNFENIKEAFELNIRTVSVDSKVINKDNKYIKSNLKVPKLIIVDKEIQSALNKKIESDIMNFYNQSFKEAQAYLDDFPESETKFAISSDYEIKKSNDKVFSILIKYYKYSGGAHGIYEYVPYNVDLTDGRVFILKDIFVQNSNYEQVINNEIKKQIKVLNKQQNLPEESTKLYAFEKIKDTQKFYLTDDKIVIFFDLYEIAPYVAGIPEFSIDKNILEDLINEKYREIIFYIPEINNV